MSYCHKGPNKYGKSRYYITPGTLAYRPDNLIKFEHHFSNYFSFGFSAMTACLQYGMLRVRPFDGVIMLIKKDLRSYTQTIHCDDRFVVLRFANYLIVNVYLSCSGTKDPESL